jgi:SAM-dependent methyltransferase
MLRGAAKAIARQIPPISRLIRQLAQDRRDVILRHLDLDGLGLEIGPSHSPLLPKSQGYRVETIDHADANHLREKYRALGQDVGRIEEVDYVSGGGSIFETIGKPGRYDYIVASHVIEHIPDILGFLQDCERLLKPNGHVSLAVPEERFSIISPTAPTAADRSRGRSRAKRNPASSTI